MKIDAHQHFWQFDPVRDAWITDDMRVLQRDFMPQDLLPSLQQHGIAGCVAVQADQSPTETQFLLHLADTSPFIYGVVGWVDFLADNLHEQLQEYKRYPRLRGFRHILQAEPAGYMTQPAFVNGVRQLARYGFTYDLLIKPHQMEEALQLLGQLGDVPVVIDHLAKPAIHSGEKTHWELNLAAMSTFANVSCKMSGMVTEADWQHWKYEDFVPYLDELFEMFGPHRILYGSDWPVCLLAADYDQQISIVHRYIHQLSADEQARILGGNAIQFYQLNQR